MTTWYTGSHSINNGGNTGWIWEGPVTTQLAINYTKNSCLGNGNISYLVGGNATRRGFCYISGLTGDPTVADSTAYDDGDFGVGAFTKTITSLKPAFNYRIRAYAINPSWTEYGLTVQMLAAPHAVCR
jgi:hypothetical protein